jgi:uncharacterized protein
MHTQTTRIGLAGGGSVSGLFVRPANARAVFVFAHGAGAGMSHVFMEDVAAGLAERDIATLRFNFPFMDALAGKRWGRPDRPEVAQAVVRAAAAHARAIAPDLPMFAGGKSFGARMTSQAQAQQPIENVRGFVFIGFPLHPAKKPSIERASHLPAVHAPMLFVQGDRDDLATIGLMRDVCASLPMCDLHVVVGANHGFSAPAKLGRTGAAITAEICDVVAKWVRTTPSAG